MSSGADPVSQAIRVANNLFTRAHECFVYRASVAYALQQIRAFLQAVQPLKGKQLAPHEAIAVERFTGLVAHFATVVPNLGQNWMRSCLTWPSTHVHDYISSLRRSLGELCQMLGLNARAVLPFDAVQDTVNRIDDFRHLRAALHDVQQKLISVDNAVDVQQLIETRLRSIGRHLPEDTDKTADPPTTNAPPPGFSLTSALAQFRAFDIPDGDIVIGKALGSGGFGTVYMGTRVSTGELIAVKEVRSDKLSISTWASLYAEVANMVNLHHRHVIELVGVQVKEPYRIITRFCPGRSLFDRIHRAPQHPLTPAKLTALAYQVALGMQFLHSNGIVHRDLKTMNILLDESDSARIADFGLSGNMRDNKNLFGTLGTPHYTAPEVLSRKRYGTKVDAYSYGIVLWEMETGLIPFKEKTHKEIIEHVVQRGWRLPLSKTIPDGLRRLITRCWSENPADRPDFAEIVQLFRRGEVFFGTPNTDSLDAPPDFPPIDSQYAATVLADPSHSAFPTVVDFFVQNASPPLIEQLRRQMIVDRYQSASAHPDRVLLAAGRLLGEDEYPAFIERVAEVLCDRLLSGDGRGVAAAAEFCATVPRKHLQRVLPFTGRFVAHLRDAEAAPPVLALLAYLGREEIVRFKAELTAFLLGRPQLDESQRVIDSVSVILPCIADAGADGGAILHLLRPSLAIPAPLAEFAVRTLHPREMPGLVEVLLASSLQKPLEKPLTDALTRCTDKIVAQMVEKPRIPELVHTLLLSGRCISQCLLILFRMARCPGVPALLANHPAFAALFEVKEHCQQRLQVLTALVLDRQFVLDTALMPDILKLLVSSIGQQELQKHALLLVGALSGSEAGCKILEEAGLLAVFSQLFLSPACNNTSVALTILRNASRMKAEIPQKSLIISCLMQDLSHPNSAKTRILYTLLELLTQSPNLVQEHDLQNSVLPLLVPKNGPVVVTLIIKLLNCCDMSKLRLIYQQILNKIYLILEQGEILFPELLLSVAELIVSMWTVYHDEMVEFLKETLFLNFYEGVSKALAAQRPEIVEQLKNVLFIINFSNNENKMAPALRSGNKQKKTYLKRSSYVFIEDELDV